MSILSAIKEIKRDNNNLQDLALLPQALVMQMAQRGEIQKELVPLILSKKAEMIESVARDRALANSGQIPPTIMEQKMAQIAQAENPAPAPQMQPQMMAQAPMPQLPEEVGIAQNPVPPMQMAGGGIIAFAPGGDVDDDDDDDESYEDYLDELQRARLESMILNTYQDTDTGAGIAQLRPPSETKTVIEEIKAPKKGKDNIEELTAYVLKKESGGRRYDKEGNLLTSPKGALGEMQVMPMTIKDPGFGVRAARDNSPDEIARVGRDYLSAMYSRYGDPKLAAIAYNMGPGATDKWLAAGADPRKLPAETRGYVAQMAQGGEVERYQTGGYRPLSAEAADYLRRQKDRFTPSGSSKTFSPDRSSRMMTGSSDVNVYPGMSDLNYYNELAAELEKDPTYEPYREEMEKLLKRNPDLLKARQPATNIIGPLAAPQKKTAATAPTGGGKAISAPPANYVPDEAGSPYIDGMPPVPGRNIQAGGSTPAEAVMSAEDKLFAQMQSALSKREARLEAARKQDPWLAGLAAGLGMLGGTSPYAMVNIGQGGGQGVAQYAASQRARAAEEAGIGALQNKMYSSALTGALRRDLQAQTKESKESKLNQDLQIAKNSFIQKRLGTLGIDEIMLGNLKRKQAIGKLSGDDAKLLDFYERQRKSIEQEADRLYSSPGSSRGVIKLS
jgi:hypothetical protein